MVLILEKEKIYGEKSSLRLGIEVLIHMDKGSLAYLYGKFTTPIKMNHHPSLLMR